MKEMTIEEHLGDLRKVLIRILVILVVSFALSCIWGQEITDLLLQPLKKTLLNRGQGQIVFLGIFDKVVAEFQVAFWFSVFVSSPLWFRELWGFIRPALHQHEVKVIRPFLYIGFAFFITGVLFGYYVLFPFTFRMLLDYGVEGVAANLSMKDYLALSSKILVLLGILFQLPNVMVILGFMGLVTMQSLSKWRPYLYVLFSILAALVSPEVISMMAVWVPLIILFEIGLLAVRFIVHPYLERRHGA